MERPLKIFLYIILCVLVFLAIVEATKKFTPSEEVSAFEWEKTINVYFVDSKKAETESCEAGVPLARVVVNAETLGPGAILALLEGLKQEEINRGLYTSINPKTLLQKFEVRDRVAYVDFDSNLNKGVAGSCTVVAIRSQIENTLVALPDIDSVVISVNNQTEGILEP